MATILITGSNRGLGLEWVRQYARLGWQVIATCRHPHEATDLQRLQLDNPNVELYRLDVTQPEAITALRQTLRDRPVDILLNNAGVYLERTGADNFGGIDYQAWEETFRVNTLGAVRMTEAFFHHLARSDKRLVVAISSHMGSITEIDSPGSYAYRSSKAALNAAMRGISLELRPHRVGVLLLHPGWVRTRMGGENAPLSTTESVNGMRAVIDTFEMSKTGRFFRFDNSEIPW